MPKNIIVLSDGTGNSAAKFNKTNVWRTYEALDLSDPEKQIAYYDDGVGNSSFKPLALLGGALGIGLSRNVRELYAYLCRNYEEGGSDLEKGDRIYGFGFSRGSFTIRTLAGFVSKFGLIKKSAYVGDRDLWKKTTWLYQAYRKACSGTGTVPIPARIIRGLRDSFATQTKKNFLQEHENFLKGHGKLFRSVEIEFLGLWDTVDAYGLPIDELTMGWDRFVWPLSMRNRDLSAKVKKAVHALSLDDERNSFHPLLWNEAGDSGVADISTVIRQDDKAKSIADEKLSQVWFAGMHANVGGGYPDDFLSYVPLNFVLDQLVKLGPPKDRILFDQIIRKAQRAAARVPGVMHDSRSGLSSYYRYLPRKLEKLLDTKRGATRLSRNWKPERFTTNVVKIERPKIHHSVFDRIATVGLGYSPIVLPTHYAEVKQGGKIENLGATTFEKSAAEAAKRAKAQERVWDVVWRRRVTYFSTLFFTGLLALLPWISFPPSVGAWLPLEVTINAGKCIDSIACPASGIPKFFGAFLPSYASTWIDSFTANPGYFFALSAAIALLMYASSRLDGKIHDKMRAIWHPGPAGVPNANYSRLYKFRESPRYQRWLRHFKYRILPTLFGLSALGSIVLIVISGVSRTVFSVVDSYGSFCSVEAKAQPTSITSDYSGPLTFYPFEQCWPSGLAAEKGATYRVVMNIADTMGSWKDDTLEADLQGNLENHWPWTAISAWPAKRYLWENYYKPVARIRTRAKNRKAGQDEYVLNPTFLSSRKRYDCLVSDFTAQSSGELFFFVNDAIIYGWPNAVKPTYKNNNGKAEVFVKRIATAGEPFALPEKMATTSACKEFVFTPPRVIPTAGQ